MVSPGGLIAQPQVSPQPAVDLSGALQQQQGKAQPQQMSPVSMQQAGNVLNTVHINLANTALAPSVATGEVKLQSAVSSAGTNTTTTTTQSALGPMGLAAGLTSATGKPIQIPASFLHQAQQHVQNQQRQLQQQQQSPVLQKPSSVASVEVSNMSRLNNVNKASLNDFLKKQVLKQGMVKPMVKSGSAVVSTSDASVPFIFTSSPAKLNLSSNGLNVIR